MPLQNPFGDAKPREAVLASRTGKSETEILVEEVKSEKPKVHHTCHTQQLLVVHLVLLGLSSCCWSCATSLSIRK